MNISAPFIRRPVATTLLTIAIALVGAIAFEILNPENHWDLKCAKSPLLRPPIAIALRLTVAAPLLVNVNVRAAVETPMVWFPKLRLVADSVGAGGSTATPSPTACATGASWVC